MPSRFRVRWTESASTDLEDIIRHISTDSPLNATAVYQRLRKRAATLRTSPNRGRPVPELVDLKVMDYRELEVPPYRIIYRIDDANVIVHAILDGRRGLREVLTDRLFRTPLR